MIVEITLTNEIGQSALLLQNGEKDDEVGITVINAKTSWVKIEELKVALRKLTEK